MSPTTMRRLERLVRAVPYVIAAAGLGWAAAVIYLTVTF